MSSRPPQSLYNDLPTLDLLGASIPENVDVQKAAKQWLLKFSQAVELKDVSAVLKTIHPSGWWRDLVALTWDLRTFHGPDELRKFLDVSLADSQLSVSPDIILEMLAKPYPDLVWIVTRFAFQTVTGEGQMTAYLVPTPAGTWQAFIVCTELDSLKGSKDHYGSGRDTTLGRADVWLAERAREQAFEDHSPEVLIVGAGQAGLDLAARLANLGLSTLIVERNERVGDQWRQRYDSLRLHDFVWLNSQPYLPFPDSFPLHVPAKKLADWFELYAKVMDLNVWTSTTVSHAAQDKDTGKWAVTVTRQDGSQRVVHTDQLVFATGWVGEPKLPSFAGLGDFKGEVIHSAEYTNAKGYVGKKVVVVGACTSAHDIAVDCADREIDVTMFQRSSTLLLRKKDLGNIVERHALYIDSGLPLETADKLSVSIPPMFHMFFGFREMESIIEGDAERRQKLEQIGYRMNSGINGTGPMWQVLARGGGQYLDQGACDLMLGGKIKIKSDTQIEKFTETGLRFQDGTEIQADVVVLATGYGDLREPIKRVIGHEMGKKLTKIWGVNEEGELNSFAKEIGIPNLWYLTGSLHYCRIYSKHIALQIKAKQMGISMIRYSAPPVY